MDIVNPIQNAPMLAPPTKRRSILHSRSPSTSPSRPWSPLTHDPLLRCLSPTSTLQAFTNKRASYVESRSSSPRRFTLDAAFKDVSEEQKELGSRAAQACLDIRGWTHELEGWEWPGVFEEPEPARKRARMSVMSMGSLASRTTHETADDDEEFWGSLPAVIVQEYDERLQEIAMQFDEIDLEELKYYTLQAHSPRIGVLEDEEKLRQLDDFTAVVTATILQTLPFVSRLTGLLDTWSVRIAILKDIPTFLKDLERLRRDLDHGWAAVAVSLRKNGLYASLGNENMQDMQTLIDTSMASLGQRLDGFLDLLEGREDTVPEIFLDKFEELEERYAEWVVMAKQRVLGDELKEFTESIDDGGITPTLLDKGAFFEADDLGKTPTAQSYAEGTKSPILLERSPDASFDRARTPTLLQHLDIMERAKTPTVLHTDVNDRAITPTIRDAATFSTSRLLQDLSEPSKAELVQNSRNVSMTALPTIAVTDEESRPTSSHSLSSKRSSRHVPIIVPLEGDGSAYENGVHEQKVAIDTPEANALTQAHRQEAERRLNGGDVTRPATSESQMTPTKKGPAELAAVEAANVHAQSPYRTPLSPKKSKVSSAGNAIARLFKREKKQDAEPERSISTKPDKVMTRARRSLSRKRPTRADTVVRASRPISQSFEIVRPQTSVPTARERASLQIERGRPTSFFGDTMKEVVPLEAMPARPQTAFLPEMSQPRRPQRPTMSPLDFPENWPLASPSTRSFAVPQSDTTTLVDQPTNARTGLSDQASAVTLRDQSGAEIDLRSVRSMAAVRSDDFQRMFIDGFPATITELPANDEDDYEADVGAQAADEGDLSALTATPTSTHRMMVPIVTSSMLSSSGRQDDLSVARAMSIEGLRQFDQFPAVPTYKYIMPVDKGASLPTIESPAADEGTPDDEVLLHDADLEYFRAATAHADEPLPEEPSFEPPPVPEDDIREASSRSLKRASMASIKSHMASEVRSIEVKKKMQKAEEEPRRDSTTLTNAAILTGSRSGAQSPTGSMDTPNFSRLRSGSMDREPPLNTAMSKRRKAPALETIKPSSEYHAVDEFDRHVSEVLEKIPAPIRFRSKEDASPRPRARAARQASGTGGLTLTAMETSPKKSATGIKLYHLTQAGRDEPIKLFIRLVGEGDRVMVRVGGGWADLADYLKQYAEHHGSRTVSGGLGFELQSADTTPAGSRRTSGILTQQSVIEGLAELPGSEVDLAAVNERLRPQSALASRSSNGNLRQKVEDEVTSERKAKWVKTMLEKAKKETSGAKSRTGTFGDMGTIGSTKRVIFRSSSAMDRR